MNIIEKYLLKCSNTTQNNIRQTNVVIKLDIELALGRISLNESNLILWNNGILSLGCIKWF